MQRLTDLYRQWSGSAPTTVERLPGAGSNRAYYRLSGANGTTVIGCLGTSREENHAFIALARHFASQGLPVPQVLAADTDETCYLQDDLGSTSLFDAIAAGRARGGQYDEQEQHLLRQATELLVRMQFEGCRGLDYSVCYPQPQFDVTGVMFDLNYFKYCFLKATGTDFHELHLEDDFRRLAHDLTTPLHRQDGVDNDSYDEAVFLYRDYQARNIMVTPGGTLAPIDFQGGRQGPYYYDLASFLWQASARYPDDLRRKLLDHYYAMAGERRPLPPRDLFDHRLRLFVLFRLLQVLGAYGFRGYFERKPHFIASIPPALDSLRHLLDRQAAAPYPHLETTLRRLTANSVRGGSAALEPTLEPAPSPAQPASRSSLVVRVFSFSYKRGIPQDESGNGGGYVFDCRGIHNPGRYDAYKQLTGLDRPVIDFLERDGEILRFLDHVYDLADAHVQRYIDRGFTSLMFAFGCTGGQHRSVYSAQHLAEHLRQKFGIEVRLCHREISTLKSQPSNPDMT